MSQNFNCPLRYVIILFWRPQYLLVESVHAEQRLANFGGFNFSAKSQNRLSLIRETIYAKISEDYTIIWLPID